MFKQFSTEPKTIQGLKLKPGGKPSTWYPPVGPLELEKMYSGSCLFRRQKSSEFKKKEKINRFEKSKETKKIELKRNNQFKKKQRKTNK